LARKRAAARAQAAVINWPSQLPPRAATQRGASPRLRSRTAGWRSTSLQPASGQLRLHCLAGPVYIRLERYSPDLYKRGRERFYDGVKILRKGKDICIIATGRMLFTALKVTQDLKRKSISAMVIDLYRIKPLNTELILKMIGQIEHIVTLEEHSICAGIGSAIAETLAEIGKVFKLKRFGFPDKFCREYGSREYLHTSINIDSQGITRNILVWLKRK